MAEPRPKSAHLRLFVALDLPDAVRGRLAEWQRREVEPIPVLRPLAPEALRLTLAFLGPRPPRDVERVARLLRQASAPELRFRADLAPVPPGRPRLFAAAAESEGTIALQAELARELTAARLYEPEERPFWPHVTVARVRPERRGSKKPARVPIAPGALPPELLEPFRGVRLRLYRSILRPQGAEYVPLASTDLKVSA